MKKHYRKENDCLNCGTILEGKFCHKCGQENLEMKESFGHMLNHAVSDYFHFDYQFFHTMRPLFLKPGHLTNEYLLGRRAQYLHPVKMYIFISLVFFLIFFKGSKHEVVKVRDDKQTELHNDNLTTSQKKEFIKSIIPFVPDTILRKINKDIDADSAKAKIRETSSEADAFAVYADEKLAKFKTHEEYLANQAKLPVAERDGWFERYIIQKSYDWKSQGKNAQEILIEGLKHNAPKMMFLLLPLFALILKLAFWGNHKFYVEHIIYTIHLHCYLFLFLTVIMLLNIIIPGSWGTVLSWIEFLSTITIIWYIYRSLRVVYGRSLIRTVSKMLGIAIMYTIVFAVSFVLVLALTAITSV